MVLKNVFVVVLINLLIIAKVSGIKIEMHLIEKILYDCCFKTSYSYHRTELGIKMGSQLLEIQMEAVDHHCIILINQEASQFLMMMMMMMMKICSMSVIISIIVLLLLNSESRILSLPLGLDMVAL